MILRAGIPLFAALALTACGPKLEDRDLRTIVVEPLSDTSFGVEIKALNVDGYELARCVAAAYADSIVDEEGERKFDVYVRDGGQITDEFRRIDGVREVTTKGVQLYSLVTPDVHTVEDHDGRDVMAVDLQLAECEKQDLPTTLGEN